MVKVNPIRVLAALAIAIVLAIMYLILWNPKGFPCYCPNCQTAAAMGIEPGAIYGQANSWSMGLLGSLVALLVVVAIVGLIVNAQPLQKWGSLQQQTLGRFQ